MTKKQKKMMGRIIVASALFIALQFVPLEGAWKLFASAGIYLIVAYDILLKSVKGVLAGQLLDENFLMTVASLGAFALGICDGSGDHNEAIAVILFYQIGELFQSCAVSKSRRSIAALMDIRPDYAHVERGGQLSTVSPDEVPIGSIIVVQPGEKVPLDGIIQEGDSLLDTSALTGESVPRSAHPGENAMSGCINLRSPLRIRTTREFGESTVTKILQLMQEAASRKSKSEQFITKFARIYTPIVCGAALLLALLPPAVLVIMGASAEWTTWLYRSLIFLVISCPCALVLSIPLSFFAGIGGAGRVGILIKGSHFMETLAQAQVAVFDKTGTLTRGVFEVVAAHHSPYSLQELLQLAAAVESASSHPISVSLRQACAQSLPPADISDMQELQGLGVISTVKGLRVAVGNEKLMAGEGVKAMPCHCVGTIVHIAINHRYAGHILISDSLKPTSVRALAELKSIGIRKTVMLTGDNSRTAEAVSRELELDEVHCELLPAHKVEEVERLMRTNMGHLFFVGDGVNDAPVLARADVGIAMGGLGSDAAIEAADVVIMDDDPARIPLAIRCARRCIRIVRQNIVFAIGAKLVCLVLGALGMANMWFAIFADVGVLILCVLNSIRAMSSK